MGTTDFYDFSYTARPSPHWQTIGNYSSQESTEKGYNEKYNVDQVPEDPLQNEEEVEEVESERGMSPTMSLVIGIIIGSFTAMILIVIIVLKVRTGVDISEIKQEELQRYQFSSPSVPEKDDLSGHMDATASTSLIAENSGAVSGKSNVTNGHGTGHNGGIFNG